MSITGILDSDKTHKKPVHRRNDSSELDVFEAARYFSGSTEVSGHNHPTSTQKLVREDHRRGWKGGRISLDFPMRNSIPSTMMEKQVKEKKKCKQPSSPGGKLASFLNSLFHQTKKKKSKSTTTTTTTTTTQSMKDEDESPGGRRKRRSSISHFRSGSNTDSKSLYSSSSSGFRTPPTKFYKDLRSYSDHKQLGSLSKYNIGPSKPTGLKHEDGDEEFRFTNGFLERFKKNSGSGFSDKDRVWADRYPSEEREIRKFDHDQVVDEGGDSDSSSDLFELENYDLGYYPSGLPVYETTHMDNIKRGAPISNGAM